MIDRRCFLAVGLAAMAVPVGQRMLGPTASGVVQLATEGLQAVPARMADEICDSYLVNTRCLYGDTVYKYTDAVVQLVQELGARVVRERVVPKPGTTNALRQQRAMSTLAASGVRWHATVGELANWSNAAAVNQGVIDYLTRTYTPQVGGDLSSLLHSFGGCNEVDPPDLSASSDWATQARIMQQALWEAARGTAATETVTVAGPSFRSELTPEEAGLIGDLSAWSELGHGHYYPKGTSPSRGFDAYLEVLRTVYPQSDRWLISESGYNNSPSNNGPTVPEGAAATYVLRGICDYFNRNAIYGRFELLDDPDQIDYTSQRSINRTAEREAHYGMVAMTKTRVGTALPGTWRKKPEFYAVQRLLSLMSDKGPGFPPEPQVMAIAGAPGDMQQTLVQKRDGRHYLLLWRDVVVSTTKRPHQPVAVTPAQVNVTLELPRPVTVHSPATRAEPLATLAPTDSFDVSLAGDLLVVELGPVQLPDPLIVQPERRRSRQL